MCLFQNSHRKYLSRVFKPFKKKTNTKYVSPFYYINKLTHIF